MGFGCDRECLASYLILLVRSFLRYDLLFERIIVAGPVPDGRLAVLSRISSLKDHARDIGDGILQRRWTTPGVYICMATP